jgi:RimJ/RimL family protein N-acetyltransferase
MRFIVGSGQQLRNRLETFPEKYRKTLASSKILVICVTSDNEVAGACSISKISNYGLSYIKESYRGRGLGTKCARIRIYAARRRGLGFVATAIHTWNLPMLRIASKLGYREVVRFRDFGYVLLMIPLNFKGELLYALLHGVCPKLPKASLHAIILVLMSVVGLIRRRLTIG